MSRPSLRSLTQLARRPSVMLTVGIGLAGLSGSAFLALINASFPKGAGSSDVLALSSLNFLLATICTGMMAGSEQEMARAVSRSIALGEDPAPVERRQYRHARWLIVGTLLATAALSPLLVGSLKHWVLVLELLVGLVGGLALYPIRGTLTGRRDYPVFSSTLVIEGLTRLIPAVVILALGVASVWLYGLVFALGGPAVACIYGLYAPRWRHRRRAARGVLPDPVPVPELAEAASTTAVNETADDGARADGQLWILTAATLANQLLFNAVPLLVAAKYGGDHGPLADKASAVAAAVGLTRLGILMMVQLQAPLLPKLTEAAAHRRFAEVRRLTGVLSLLAGAVGLAGSLGCWLLGPWVLTTIMRAHHSLPGAYLAVLALGTAFVMVGFILQAALVAMDRHVIVLIAWAAGAAVTVPVFLLGEGLLRTTALAGVIGPFVAMLVMAADAWLRTRGGNREESTDGAVVADSAPALQ
jgi:O-antigen/teichoic acid export membrane protein